MIINIEERKYAIKIWTHDCWELSGGSPTLPNLGNNHGFISKEYISIGTRLFGETQSKSMRGYAQSGQYHIIVESRDS